MAGDLDNPTSNGAPDSMPDQTIGYESLAPVDTATDEADTDPNVTRAATPDVYASATLSKKPPSSFRTPGPSGGTRLNATAVFAQSIITAAGNRVAPECLVGPYEILDELGKGGMGIVYKARHIHLNRIVALKMIIGGANVGEAHLERFRAEAEAVAKLNHPNIVQVYDVGEHNGAPYLALELVDGGNLHTKLDGKPQNAKYAAQTVETLCRAVHAAHAAGVIHRDLKPQNVLLTLDGQPKVTDFGLAKDIAQNSGQTHAGTILGTPSYMAPEQAAGRVHDICPATDTYALGCILYEILTGRPPFSGESAIATIRMVLDSEIIPPRTLKSSIPRDLDTICLKALQKPAHRRYITAEEFAEDLRRYLDGEPIAARPVGSVERFIKWVRRHPTATSVIASGILATFAMIALGIWSYVAVTNRAKEAEESRSKASSALEESNRRLVRLNVTNGTRMLDTQDYLGAPLWYAEALRLEQGGIERENIHRIRLRSVFDHCPRLSNIWLHEATMTDAQYDGTGRLVLAISDDGIGRVWDAKEGSAVSPPLEHGGRIVASALAPDGSRAATAGADGTTRIWDAKTGRLLFVLPNGATLTRVEFAPNSRTLITGCIAGRVRGWDSHTGKELFSATFADRITSLAIDLAGKRFAATSKDQTARVFDLITGQPLTLPLKHAGAVNQVAFFPNGDRVATASADGTAIIWDVANGTPTLAMPLRHPAAINAIAVTADGLRVITGSSDSTAKVWDAVTGQSVGRPEAHDGPVQILAVSPDGRWFASGGDDNAIRIWDTSTGEMIAPPLRHNSTPLGVQFSPNGYELLVVDQTRAVRTWNLITHGELSGSTIAPAGTVVPVENANRDEIRTILSPEGTMSLTYGGGQAVRVRRTNDHEPVTPPLRTGAAIVTAAFSPDGSMIATGDLDGHVMLWDILKEGNRGKPVWAASGRHVSRVLSLTFNAKGNALASTSEDNTARLWDVADGSPLVPPVRLGATVLRSEFSLNGKLFYTELPNGKGRVWDAATGETVTPPFPARPDWESTLVIAKWSVEEMLAAGRMLSGQRLSEAGDVIPSEPGQFQDDWKLLKSKYPVVATTDRSVVGKWWLRQADVSEKNGRWFAMAWHLDRLIAETPDQPEYRRRKAIASAKLRDWQGSSNEAAKAILLQPDLPDNWYQAGVALGQLGDWDGSAAHLSKAMQLRADPTSAVGLLPLVRLHANDREGYQKACRDLTDFYRGTHDANEAHRVAWVCSLSPDSGIDPQQVLKLAEVGTIASDFATMVMGASLMRAGRFEEAAAKLKAICESKAERPAAWLIYCIVQNRLGHATDAKIWREKAEMWLKRETKPGQVPPAWDTRAEVEILLREASR